MVERKQETAQEGSVIKGTIAVDQRCKIKPKDVNRNNCGESQQTKTPLDLEV